MKTFDYILKDAKYEFQQDNRNADDSDNMVWSPKWRRFNQCFISSHTMVLNQALTRIRDKGITKNESFQKSFFDERTILLVILSKLNGGTVDKDNDERYHWKVQLDVMNQLLSGCFKGKVPGEFVQAPATVEGIIQALKSNYQPIVGIWIQKYYKTGKGHVTTAVGWREDEKGNILGLFYNDPAGNLLKPRLSYKDATPTDGKEVFYPIKVVKEDLLINKRQMIYFEEA